MRWRILPPLFLRRLYLSADVLVQSLSFHQPTSLLLLFLSLYPLSSILNSRRLIFHLSLHSALRQRWGRIRGGGGYLVNHVLHYDNIREDILLDLRGCALWED